MGKKIESRKETPDVLARFQGRSRLDKPPHEVLGHDMGTIIKGAAKIASSPNGAHRHLDGPATGMGQPRKEALGVGGGDLRAAASSIPSGARAAKVDWSKLK